MKCCKKSKNTNGLVDGLNVKCECSTCSLEICRIEESYDKGEAFKTFEVSVWRLASGDRPLGWKERFRWAWRVLRTGMPWSDMIILSDDNARKVAKFINKYL